jgi:hypothetical protein
MAVELWCCCSTAWEKWRAPRVEIQFGHVTAISRFTNLHFSADKSGTTMKTILHFQRSIDLEAD